MGDPGSSNARMSMGCSVPEKLQLHLAMLALQFGYAGFHIVSRAALNMGISKTVFIVYRNIIALLLLSPFAYFLEKKERPSININFLVQFFLLALVGITANQGFYFLGLENTSPTFASAIQNSVPGITFLMAVLLRIEQVRLNRKDGITKVIGTVCCVAGASIITLYKGPAIYSPGSTLHQLSTYNHYLHLDLASSSSSFLGDANGRNWTLGCLFLIGHCLSWSGWLVMQAPVLKKYPARLSVTSYTCFFGLLQFLVIAAFTERDATAWHVATGGEIFTVFYAGVVASGIASAVQIWCIDRGGPVFVAMYQPVQTFVVAIMATLLLGEEFYLGGMLGAAVIIVGLYLVLWGKKEEAKFNLQEEGDGDKTTKVAAVSTIKETSITHPLLSQTTFDCPPKKTNPCCFPCSSCSMLCLAKKIITKTALH